MSFNPVMALLVADATPFLPLRSAVCELGSQTWTAETVWPKIWEKDSADERPVCTDVPTFYRLLGFTRYESLDLDGKGTLRWDLNTPLSANHAARGAFALVTNNGTGEHVFDQANVFRLMHDLCQPGGVLLFALPFHRWLNHGFYAFQPKLFVDLAKANGYDILELELNERAGLRVSLMDGINLRGRTYKESWRKVCREGVRQFDKLPGAQVAALLRKVNSEPWKLPMDGRYPDLVGDNT